MENLSKNAQIFNQADKYFKFYDNLEKKFFSYYFIRLRSLKFSNRFRMLLKYDSNTGYEFRNRPQEAALHAERFVKFYEKAMEQLEEIDSVIPGSQKIDAGINLL